MDYPLNIGMVPRYMYCLNSLDLIVSLPPSLRLPSCAFVRRALVRLYLVAPNHLGSAAMQRGGGAWRRGGLLGCLCGQ